MPSGPSFTPGQWWVHCDVCGFKYKSGDVRKRWDGLYVCHDDFELDHPQKYLRVHGDKQSVPFVRHQADDTFITVCTPWGRSGYAGLGEAGCMQAGNTAQSYAMLLQLKMDGTQT